MKNAVLKMYENGQLQSIKKKWKVLKPQCAPILRKGEPLSFKKLIFLFSIIGFGILIAFFVLTCEWFSKPQKVIKSDADLNIEHFRHILSEVNLCLKKNEKPPKHLMISLRKFIDERSNIKVQVSR